MLYTDVFGDKISRLGFGLMRLPRREDGSIDSVKLDELVDFAIKNGVNYFDTACPYHGGMSEVEIGRSLSRYPRESFILADKYPGHQMVSSYAPSCIGEIFSQQLEKCRVDYFDYYLMHNVNENSMAIYDDPKWGIIDYFVEQRRLGKIRHLGFSCHAGPEDLTKFLDKYGDVMEFCQIQLNYLDWTLQRGEETYKVLEERNIPMWIMEPVRGGKLAKLDDETETKMKKMRPDESVPAWAFRYLQDLPAIKVILSGMSNMEQVADNIKTFSELKPLNEEEKAVVYRAGEILADCIPCTACRYCCDGCPAGLDIPALIKLFNDINVHASLNMSMHLGAIPEDKLPSACIGCGACAHACPQKIDVPAVMAAFTKRIETLPVWEDVCHDRAREHYESMKK